ncbi:MAG: hypothetical protein R3C16_01160 [Hyphomonadaceae bacterium]
MASAISIVTAQPEIYLNFREVRSSMAKSPRSSLRTLLLNWNTKFADWIARLRQPALTF